MTAVAAPFRFDASHHEYIDIASGETYEHITGLLEVSGWVDDQWFTEESSVRGRAVHRLTADVDLGAIEDPRSVVSGYKPYLLAHVGAVQLSGVQMLTVEEPRVHPTLRFAGRPDRSALAYGVRGPWEVKSGDYAKGHQIQTAMQAILLEAELAIPAHLQARWCCYVRPNGRFKLEEFKDRRDIDEAYRIIRRYCR